MKRNRYVTCGATSLLTAVLIALPSQTVAQTASERTSTSPRPVVLSLEPYADTPLKTVSVKVGAKTVPFLFDTGGGLTVVSPEVADALSCAPFGQVTGFRADGTKVTEKRCGPIPLRIGAYETTGEVGVFDLMALIRNQVEHAREMGKDVAMPAALGGLIGLS